MPLSPGSHLGPYEVLALIGAGGMGEVYRARDPRLGREVAIKVLPHDRVADESRRQRFVQEAKAASALNHPHIVTIHEIESANGIDFLVMEYVRGKSLDALIPRQGMRLGEALRVAIAVADAVACAHKSNIVHRDLKPANVMVGTDGAVKVLDFGLAKLLTDDRDPDPHAQTRTADDAISKRGAVMGTLAYMSPEQASGEAVDARSDVFSFGAMLYEMVTGERAFASKTQTDTLANVLRAQPKAPSTIVPSVPSDLEKVIARCLRKDPDRRFQTMLDVKIELQEIKEDSGSSPPAAPLARARSWRPVSRRSLILMTSAAAGGACLLFIGVRYLGGGNESNSSPSGGRVVPLTTQTGIEFDPAFSPDGNQVVYSWSEDEQHRIGLWQTVVGSTDVRKLTEGTGNDMNARFSPDGGQIAFIRTQDEQERPPWPLPGGSSRRIMLVSALGGPAAKVSDFPAARAGIAWSPDGRTIIAGRDATDDPPGDRGMYAISIAGGNPRAITRAPAPTAHVDPALTVNGRRLAFVSCRSTVPVLFDCEIDVVDVDTDLKPTSSVRRLVAMPIIRGPAWTQDGKSLVFTGDPEGNQSQYLWKVSAEAPGLPERIEMAGRDIGEHSAVASTRARLAFSRLEVDTDILRITLGQPASTLISSSSQEQQGTYSEDGRHIAFSSNRSGPIAVWVAETDGSAPHQLTHGKNHHEAAPKWSPDGKHIAFDSQSRDGHWHVWVTDADGGQATQLTFDAAAQNLPFWSRDGAWVYYVSGHGREVARVPVKGGSVQAIVKGGTGLIASETIDGTAIVYQPIEGDSPLLERRIIGGPVRQVLPCVQAGAFMVHPKGIYYIPCGLKGDVIVRLVSAVDHQDRPLWTLKAYDGYSGWSLSVSPDGNALLYTSTVNSRADLWTIENFK
jgi:serine/threonine protein kinase